MKEVTEDQLTEIRDIVYEYFEEECEVDRSEISDDTNIINELEGDSLMLLSLLEIFRKKYNLSIELKTLGKHLMKKPADTVGQVVNLSANILRFGDDIINAEI